MMYSTLRQAIQNCPGQCRIVAEDISASGQKQFYVGTVDRLRSIHDSQQEHHWYECLLENRPTKLFLDIESDRPVSVEQIVAFFARAVQHQFGRDCEFQILNSCSQTKLSWHVIAPDLVFKNVYHVGAFVRRTVLAMQNDPIALAIDTAVYTKNRMFRLRGSSKMGSERILTHNDPWWELLVQTSGAVETLECLEINQSEPVSTSIHPRNLFHMKENGEWAIQQTPSGSSVQVTCPMLNPILDWLDSQEQAMTLRHKIKLISTGFYSVPAKSKKCYIAKRTHKGNAIWYLIDLTRKQIIQRCLDSECGRQKYCIQHPENIWKRWTAAWVTIEPAPNNQNTLYKLPH